MNITITQNQGAEAEPKPFLGLSANQVQQVEREAKAEWTRNASERAAFGDDFAAFLSYRKAEQAGKVRAAGVRRV